MDEKFVFSILFLFLFIGLLGGILIDSSIVRASPNATTASVVNVTNTEPTITTIELTPGVVDLNPGNTTTLNCTGFVHEVNGPEDIYNVNVTLYDNEFGLVGEADNNFRYINQSCGNCSLVSGSNVSCNCQIEVEYYANNGSWQCNMTVTDSFNLTSSNISNNVTINTVIAIEVPSILDYGNLSVTETSALIEQNISNIGNVPLNISIRGYGGEIEEDPMVGNYSMMCETGNISSYFQRYSIDNSTAYEQMLNLTNESTLINDFPLYIRNNDTNPGNDTNSTFWRLQVPLTIAGYCNGSIIYEATQTLVP